jgi:hypothetical protein
MNPQIFSAAVTRKAVCGITRAVGFAASVGAIAATGCAPQFQTQLIGQSTTVAGPPGVGPAAIAEIPVPASQSAQVLSYVVSLPRAVQLHYQVICPTTEREGNIGETFEAYRTRRLAELERERRQQANLIGAVVGAVAPPVRASAGVAGPDGAATATAQFSPGAAAAEAARESLPAASLPPGDTGATVVRGKVELVASPAGRCALTLTTDPAAQDASGTQVTLELVRLVDVEAEERERLAAIRAEQDEKARELRVWMLASLQRQGADPLARERARAAAQAKAEVEARNREARAIEETQRRQAAAIEEQRRQQAAADEALRRRQAEQSRAEQERLQREQQRVAQENAARAEVERAAGERRAAEWRARQAALTVRWQIFAQLQRLGADPLARERARAAALARADEENRRRQAAAEEESRRRQAAEQERLRREREAAAERERREAPERERRAKAERDRLAREEADRRAKEEAERKAWLAAEEARLKVEYDARLKVEREAEERRTRIEREAADRRAREWRSHQAAVALRWQVLARLQRNGADPLHRQKMEEARLAARREEQRRQYEAKARRELDIAVARRQAIDLRFNLVARLRSMGADPDYRRKRDEAMFREMDAEARRLDAARAEAAERVRWETQAAIDLRVLTKLRLRQAGAADRPTCPPPPLETPPPAPFAGATWIAGRYDWNGIAWVWASGHYEHPPEAGAVWVPPANIAISGTLVVRPGRWVRITPPTAPGIPRH